MLLKYSQGNLAIFQELSFSEILEAINYMQERENDEYLLKIYSSTFASLAGIGFDEFKNEVLKNAKRYNGVNNDIESDEIEKNVADILDNNRWEVESNGS